MKNPANIPICNANEPYIDGHSINIWKRNNLINIIPYEYTVIMDRAYTKNHNRILFGIDYVKYKNHKK